MFSRQFIERTNHFSTWSTFTFDGTGPGPLFGPVGFYWQRRPTGDHLFQLAAEFHSLEGRWRARMRQLMGWLASQQNCLEWTVGHRTEPHMVAAATAIHISTLPCLPTGVTLFRGALMKCTAVNKSSGFFFIKLTWINILAKVSGGLFLYGER